MLSVTRALLVAGLLLCQPPVQGDTTVRTVRELESSLGGRIGYFLHDLHTGRTQAYNADFRFPLNSTFKLFACAALLSRVENGDSRLTDTVDLRDLETVSYSPAVTLAISEGRVNASLDELCRMMLSVSDNSAANLVLEAIGGPEGFTAYMRSIGDDITRLDRWETALNEGLPGDVRDTTTPREIAESLRKVLLGTALSLSSRATLGRWLSGHRVADDLFRSVLPRDWTIYDRTGAGGHGTRSIVAVICPPSRSPIIASVYMRDTTVGIDERNAAIATIGESIVASVLRESPQVQVDDSPLTGRDELPAGCSL